jgi:CHAT domain-containing protein/tetratricopeptide (TPR) repeat protein
MRLRAALLSLSLIAAAPRLLAAQGTDAVELPGRVMTVSRDGKTVTVSRGADVKVIPGSRCVIRPDRAADTSEVQWDIAIAEGRVTEVHADSAVVEITLQRDPVRDGDYCALSTSLPKALTDTDMGRIAWYGANILDQIDAQPLFSLEELVRGPLPDVEAGIIQRLLAKIHDGASMQDAGMDARITVGQFAGMTVREAARAATPEHVRRMLEYLSYRIGGYINKYLTLLNLFSSWAVMGAESGEPYKSRERVKPLVLKGNELAKGGAFPEAMEAFKEALGLAPDHEEARKRLALVDSVIAKDRMLAEDPGDVTVQAQMGKDLYALGRYGDAVSRLRAAKDLGSSDPEVDLTIGYALTAAERYAEASAVFAALLADSPRDESLGRWSRYAAARAAQSGKELSAESCLAVAAIYYEFGDYGSAISSCNTALEIQPDMNAAWVLALKASKRRSAATRQAWAKQDWRDGGFNAAKQSWRSAEKTCTEIGDVQGRISVLAEMADALYDSSFYTEAIAVRREILALDLKNSEACISIARCYSSLHDYESAGEWARQGIFLDPSSAWGFTVLGNIETSTGALDDAIRHLQEAARLDPGYLYSFSNLGSAYVLKKDYEKARNSYLRVLKGDAARLDARQNLAAIECVLETRDLLTRNPEDTEARIRLGKALAFLDDYEGAIRELSRAVAADPKSFPALFALGRAYDSAGRREESGRCMAAADALRSNPLLRTWRDYENAQLVIARDPEDASGHVMLGDAYVGFAQFDNALAQYERARALGAETLSVDEKMARARTGKEADRLHAIAVDAYQRREYVRTLEYDGRALPLYHALGDAQEEFTVHMLMGAAYTQLYRHDEATACLALAGRISESLGDESLQAQLLSALGDCDYIVGDMKSALDHKSRARDLYHRENDLINEANYCLTSIGQIQGNLGEQDAMIQSYARALEMFRRLADANGESWTLSSMGWAFALQGDYTKALDNMQQALRAAHDAGDRQGEVNAYRGIGNVYIDLGDAGRALEQLQKCESAATALGSKWDRAAINNNIGLVHLELTKDYDKAIARFQTCAILGRQVGDARLEGCALGNVGVAYCRQGKAAEALSFQEDGLRLVRSVRDRSLEMQGLDLLGETYQRLGDSRTALARHMEALSLCTSIGDTSTLWKILLNAGKDYEATGDIAKAVACYERAVGTLSGIKGRIANEQLRQGFGDQERQTEAYQRLIDILLRLGRTEDALRFVEESRSKIIRDLFAGAKPRTTEKELGATLADVDRTDKKKDALEKQIQEEKAKPPEGQDAKKLDILTSTLATTEGEFNQCMLRLKFQNRRMYDALAIKPTTLGDIQGDMPSDALFLEYFISADRLYVFCIAKSLFVVKAVEVGEEALGGLVGEYVETLKDGYAKLEDVRSRGSRLYDILVRPVEAVMAPYRTIIVVPFGALYYLPFPALVREEGGSWQYLLERARICTTTSSTLADDLKNQRKGMDTILAIGNPDGSLPGASEEVALLKEKVFAGRARVWTLADATKANFLASAKNYDIVHLATHGIIRENPLESYLLFAGDGAEAQQLTLLEVAGYTALRARTSLVFLSACETAVEKGAGNGSELISLAEAFAMAGPPTLVATLWMVDDAATSRLVLEFYRQIGKGDTLDALRTAQLSLLHDKELSLPYFWAPFVMMGSWR